MAQSNEQGGDLYSKIQNLVSDVSFDDLSTEVAMVEITRLIEAYRKQHELEVLDRVEEAYDPYDPNFYDAIERVRKEVKS